MPYRIITVLWSGLWKAARAFKHQMRILSTLPALLWRTYEHAMLNTCSNKALINMKIKINL